MSLSKQNKKARIYIAPNRTANPQRRFTITIHADVITIMTNCFHTRGLPLVDDEMLLVKSHRKLRQEASSITLGHQPEPQKNVLRIVDDVVLELVANVRMTATRNIEGSSLILPPNHLSTSVPAHKWPCSSKCTL